MDPIHLLVVAAALGGGAFVKGATGMGLPLISMPVLASFLGLPHALCVLIVPILATNLWQIWRFRGEHSARVSAALSRLIAGTVLGMVIGTVALATVEERLLVLTLGLMIFAYLALRFIRPEFALDRDTAKRIAAPVGLAAGISQGATGISAPIIVTFVHAMRLNYGSHVFILSGVFLLSTVVQAATLIGTGILKWNWVGEGIFALLPVAVAMPLGQRVGARMNNVIFDKVILVFLAVIGVLLVGGW
jgi:uncharacterized protein